MTVSNDHKRVTINAKLDVVSGNVSAVLPCQSTIKFNEDSDSKTSRGSKLIARIAGKIFDPRNLATSGIKTTL